MNRSRWFKEAKHAGRALLLSVVLLPGLCPAQDISWERLSDGVNGFSVEPGRRLSYRAEHVGCRYGSGTDEVLRSSLCSGRPFRASQNRRMAEANRPSCVIQCGVVP